MSSVTHTPDQGITTPNGSLRRRVAAGLVKGVKKVFRPATSSLIGVTGGEVGENKPLRPDFGRLPDLSALAISDSVSQMGSPRTPGPPSSVAEQEMAQDDNIDQPAFQGQETLGHHESTSKDGSIISNTVNDPTAPADEPPPPSLGSVSITQSPPSDEASLGVPPWTIPILNRTENMKEAFGVAGRFAKTLLKKLPDLSDPNPVKVALSVAKVVLEAKESIDGNKEEIATHTFDILANLCVIEAATQDGVPEPAEAALSSFKDALRSALKNLENLKSASLARQIFDYEEAASKINAIFRRMDASRNKFLTEMAMSIQQTATLMAKDIKKERLYRLRPSDNADYRSVLLEQAIRREECAAGTRVGILKDIEDWANDAAEGSPAVFWLTGQAGSGKTTIATTIATMFGETETSGRTVLGANFFCSRQFPETRNPTRIMPTIAYQLARRCTPFSDALLVGDRFDAVSYATSKQLRSLFVTPWLQSERVCTNSAPYLIIIDALDELADDGSTVFLDSLFTLLNDVTLKGFKIFITSRTDPKIVNLIASFSAKTERWLQRVPLHEVTSDIAKYLKLHLPRLSGEDLSKLEALADGLFIHAATTVRYLTPRSDIQQDEQMELLDELLHYALERKISADRSGSEFIIDVLYQHILRDAFSASRGKQRQRRLSAIHMLLSTGERSSPYVISALLGEDGPTPETVLAVVDSLHAVLYVQDGSIFWYHASFPDFIFDSARSNFKLHGQFFTFSCDEYLLQTQLRDLCFTCLNKLKFNICNIPSSFLLDDAHYDIDPLLAYSAMNWSHHLPISGDSTIVSQEIKAFLELRALFWIEVMNLIKQVDKCSSVLHRARRWVEQYDEPNADLLGGLQEVIEFAGQLGLPKWSFRRSTPHLYISYLATWSEGPGIVHTWKSNFSKLPVLTHTNTDILVKFTSGQPNQSSSFIPLTKNSANPLSVSFLHHDNTQIVSGHRDGLVKIWDAFSGILLKKLYHHYDHVYSVAVATDTALIVSGSNDQTVRVWDALRGSLLHTLEGHSDRVSSVAVSQDGKRIISSSFDHTVIIWDLNLVSGQWESKILTDCNDTVFSVAISYNGIYAVSGLGDKTACIWNTSTCELLHTLEGHTDWVTSVAVSLDNTQVVSGSSDKTVRLWAVSTGEEVFCMEGHLADIYSVAFSPNGTVVSGSKDKTVRLWNSSTGQQSHVFYGHQYELHSVAFSNDGSHVVSSGLDGSIRVWNTTGNQKLVLLHHSSTRTTPYSNYTPAPEDGTSEYADTSREDWISMVDPRCAQWRVSEDGWIVSTKSDDRLMWVDRTRKDSKVQDPACILVISKEGYDSVDFSNSLDMLGDNWASCYTPIQSG